MRDTPRAGACSRQFTQSRSPTGATARMLTVIVVALALGQSGCAAWNHAAHPYDEPGRDQRPWYWCGRWYVTAGLDTTAALFFGSGAVATAAQSNVSNNGKTIAFATIFGAGYAASAALGYFDGHRCQQLKDERNRQSPDAVRLEPYAPLPSSTSSAPLPLASSVSAREGASP